MYQGCGWCSNSRRFFCSSFCVFFLCLLVITHCNCTTFPYFPSLFKVSKRTACNSYYILAELIPLWIQTHLTHVLIRQVTLLFWGGELAWWKWAAILHIHKHPHADRAVQESTILPVNAELRTVPAITNTLRTITWCQKKKVSSSRALFSPTVWQCPKNYETAGCLLPIMRGQWWLFEPC